MEKPTNILVECPELIPSARKGVLEPLYVLESMGLCIVKFKETKLITKSDIMWCDVYICVRGCERISVELLKTAKHVGRYVVYFLDDDLLNIPKNTGAFSYFDNPNIKKGIKEGLSICDTLWGVNNLLIEKYKNYIKGNTATSRVPSMIIEQKQDLHAPIKILYAGSTDHTQIVQKYLSPAIRKLCQKYKDEIQVTFIGAYPALDDVDNVKYYSFINSYNEYKNKVYGAGYQIGLAIVDTTEFYQCKYYNKFIEYTEIGATGIYTNSEPYTSVIRNNDNGYLCNNTVDEWYEAIKFAIEDTASRLECIKNARELIKSDFNAEQVAKDLIKNLPELVNFNASSIAISEIQLKNVKLKFYWGRIKILWYMKGILTIPIVLLKIFKKTMKKIKQWGAI